MFDSITKYIQQHTGWELFGMTGGIILGVFLLIKLPVIIRDLKKHYQEKENLSRAENHKWMLFLYDSAEKQRNLITDKEVEICWELFIGCIQSIQKDFGNWNSCIELTDLEKLIQIIEHNVENNPANIGEDLFYIQLLSPDRLEVQLMSEKEICSATLMLKELKILKKQLQDYKIN